MGECFLFFLLCSGKLGDDDDDDAMASSFIYLIDVSGLREWNRVGWRLFCLRALFAVVARGKVQ